jgi:hypothetical protein
METAKKLLSGVLWVGRGTATLMGVVVFLALVLGVTTSALAGTGVGATFDLGRTNTVDALSRLVGSTNDALLRIDNGNDGTSATALDLRVEPGHAPMKVDSDTKVVGLNVDEVDGKSESSFLGANERASDAAHADFADKAAGATFADRADLADQAAKADHATHAARADRAANAGKVDGLNADEIRVNGRSRVFVESDSNSVSPKSATAYCPSGKVVVGTGYYIVGGTVGNGGNQETNVVANAVVPELTNVEVIAYEENPTNADWSVYAYAVCAQQAF